MSSDSVFEQEILFDWVHIYTQNTPEIQATEEPQAVECDGQGEFDFDPSTYAEADVEYIRARQALGQFGVSQSDLI